MLLDIAIGAGWLGFAVLNYGTLNAIGDHHWLDAFERFCGDGDAGANGSWYRVKSAGLPIPSYIEGIAQQRLKKMDNELYSNDPNFLADHYYLRHKDVEYCANATLAITGPICFVILFLMEMGWPWKHGWRLK